MPESAASLQKPWYKTGAGLIFSLLLLLIALIALIFGCLTVYYVWQIRAGRGDAIVEQFSRNFTPSDLPAATTVTSDTKAVIRPFNPTLGPSSAPVTIIAFIDFECPFCQASYPIFKQAVDIYSPVVKVVFKHFPLQDLHPNALAAATAAACMQTQNRFWPYYHQLFATQLLDLPALTQSAISVGGDEARFTACLENGKAETNVTTDLSDGISLGVRGTPTYFVNNKKIEGVPDLAAWKKIIGDELKHAKN